jgi:hypothetical protein
VFVRSGGTLTIQGGAGRSLVANVVSGGAGYQSGAAAGSGLFAMSGTTVMVDIAGEYRIDDDIGDDSPLTLPAGHGYTPGNGGGAALFKLGVGTLYFDGIGTFAGSTGVLGGTFAGNGVVAGPVLVDSGAAIAPGDRAANGGVGTLIVGPLTWTGGGAMQFQLGATQAGSDGLVALGPLQKSGAGDYTFHFGMGSRPPVAGTVYALIQSTNAGAFSPTDFSYDFDATYAALSGHFGIANNVVAFQVDSVTADRIFANGF